MSKPNHNEALILALLGQFKRPVVRTKLVKLVYLLDNLRYEQLNEQATDFAYIWDYYGPNSLGNAITETLSSLTKRGFIAMTEQLTPYEHYAHYYKATDIVDPARLPISSDDWVFVKAVFTKYGGLPRSAVVTASKQTPPMHRAKQFRPLTFQGHPAVEALRQQFFADETFAKETMKAMASTNERITWDALKAGLEQRVNI